MKYEYIDGEVYAMSGGTTGHSRLAANMIMLLNEQLQSGPCLVYTNDMRVQLSEERYVLPDVVVSCDVADAQKGNTLLRSPRLVVEVLSPGTELKDRSVKLAAYQQCPSVQEYVLVSQQRYTVEVYRRSGEKTWTHHRYEAGDEVELESLDIRLPMNRIYHRVPMEL